MPRALLNLLKQTSEAEKTARSSTSIPNLEQSRNCELQEISIFPKYEEEIKVPTHTKIVDFEEIIQELESSQEMITQDVT